MYFEGGISSVYLWDLEDGAGAGGSGGKEVMFAGVVLMKKSKLIHARKCTVHGRADMFSIDK